MNTTETKTQGNTWVENELQLATSIREVHDKTRANVLAIVEWKLETNTNDLDALAATKSLELMVALRDTQRKVATIMWLGNPLLLSISK